MYTSKGIQSKKLSFCTCLIAVITVWAYVFVYIAEPAQAGGQRYLAPGSVFESALTALELQLKELARRTALSDDPEEVAGFARTGREVYANATFLYKRGKAPRSHWERFYRSVWDANPDTPTHVAQDPAVNVPSMPVAAAPRVLTVDSGHEPEKLAQAADGVGSRQSNRWLASVGDPVSLHTQVRDQVAQKIGLIEGGEGDGMQEKRFFLLSNSIGDGAAEVAIDVRVDRFVSMKPEELLQILQDPTRSEETVLALRALHEQDERIPMLMLQALDHDLPHHIYLGIRGFLEERYNKYELDSMRLNITMQSRGIKWLSRIKFPILYFAPMLFGMVLTLAMVGLAWQTWNGDPPTDATIEILLWSAVFVFLFTPLFTALANFEIKRIINKKLEHVLNYPVISEPDWLGQAVEEIRLEPTHHLLNADIVSRWLASVGDPGSLHTQVRDFVDQHRGYFRSWDVGTKMHQRLENHTNALVERIRQVARNIGLIEGEGDGISDFNSEFAPQPNSNITAVIKNPMARFEPVRSSQQGVVIESPRFRPRMTPARREILIVKRAGILNKTLDIVAHGSEAVEDVWVVAKMLKLRNPELDFRSPNSGIRLTYILPFNATQEEVAKFAAYGLVLLESDIKGTLSIRAVRKAFMTKFDTPFAINGLIVDPATWRLYPEEDHPRMRSTLTVALLNATRTFNDVIGVDAVDSNIAYMLLDLVETARAA